jgi:hypothetical protein
MKKPKYPKGLKVEFTFKNDGTPSERWLDKNKKGYGDVVSFRRNIGDYGVKVIDPPNWTRGHSCDGILKGKDIRKGWFLDESAIRPAILSAMVSKSATTKTMSSSQRFSNGTKVEFTFSDDGQPSIYVWKNNSKKGCGVVVDYNDNPLYYPYVVKIVDPAGLKGKEYCFDENALRQVAGWVEMEDLELESSKTKKDEGKEDVPEGEKMFKFFKGEEKVERICPECGEPMKKLWSTYYCPNGCDKMP